MKVPSGKIITKKHIAQVFRTEDPASPYAKRPMYGHTHPYFCSLVYGHQDYNKRRSIPIKGNERFCALVIAYADKFFGPIYDNK